MRKKLKYHVREKFKNSVYHHDDMKSQIFSNIPALIVLLTGLSAFVILILLFPVGMKVNYPYFFLFLSGFLGIYLMIAKKGLYYPRAAYLAKAIFWAITSLILYISSNAFLDQFYSDFSLYLHIGVSLIAYIVFIIQRFLSIDFEKVITTYFEEFWFDRKNAVLHYFPIGDDLFNRKGILLIARFEKKFLKYFVYYVMLPIIYIGPALVGISMAMGKLGYQNIRSMLVGYGTYILAFIFMYIAIPNIAFYVILGQKEKEIGQKIVYVDIDIIKEKLK